MRSVFVVFPLVAALAAQEAWPAGDGGQEKKGDREKDEWVTIGEAGGGEGKGGSGRDESEGDLVDELIRRALPLDPDTIRRARRRREAQAMAAGEPVASPRAVQRYLPVSLEPGQDVRIMNVYPGNTSAVVMHDAAGEPWPIERVDIGHPSRYTVTYRPGGASITLTPTDYVNTNLIIHLKGNETPIPLLLRINQKEVDLTLDLRVADLSTPEDGGQPVEVGDGYIDPMLLQVLLGLKPDGTVPLRVTGPDPRARAWKGKDDLYLLTSMTVLSPAPLEPGGVQVGSGGKLRAYHLPWAPLILASHNGELVEVRLGE